MVKRIAISMIEGLATTLASLSDPYEAGDLQWSAKSSKSKWLKCEGQAVSRTTYAALFAVVGVVFGAGDGSTTFNLPDVSGRALIGTGPAGSGITARVLGANGGAETHVLTTPQMPSHSHTGSAASAGAHTHTHPVPSQGGNILGGYADFTSSGGAAPVPTSLDGAHAHTLSINNSGGGEAHNNMQPFVAAHLFIYAGV